MSKKKTSSKQTPGKQTPGKQTSANQSAPPKSGGSKNIMIIAAVVIVVAIGAFAMSQGGSKGGTQANGGTAPTPTAEEAKYIGRYLPEGYAEPTVGEGGAVTADTPMTTIDATTDDAGISVAVADVTGNRNVAFQYTKADGNAVPLIAYVKPSGKLFVGVSYCVPCQGTGQTLTTDGNLTCDSCGTKRDPESGVGISGACKLYPLDELPVKVEGDRIVIEKTVLEDWTVQPTDRQVG